MRKKMYALITLVFLFTSQIFGQNQIVVQNGGLLGYYENLDTAIHYANNGDTLYLSGGSFQIHSSLSKSLHLIGVGHHPDSTNATLPTYIFGNIYLIPGSDFSSFSGLKIVNEVSYGDSSNSGCANNCSFYRCNIGRVSSHLFNNYAPSNNTFIENIINSHFDFSGGNNNTLLNNFLYSIHQIGENNLIKNNIFLCSYRNIVDFDGVTHNNLFENNIFMAGSSTIQCLVECNSNIFNNNLFVENISFPVGTNIGSNNIVNQPPESIFMNQSGETFDYSHDYNLNPACPGNNAGIDGTDIGIYGGVFPWKDGSLPPNPHITSKTISSTTDPNGSLPINVTVKAQNN